MLFSHSDFQLGSKLDSTVDAGNNNYIHKAMRANYLPYGIDFSNTPTGRFTNRKTIANLFGIILLTTVNCTLPLVWFGFILIISSKCFKFNFLCCDVIREAILYNLSLPPPYLNLTEAQRKATMDGINYASVGCGISPNTKPTRFDCWSLQIQIEAFNRTVQEDLPCMIEDPQELAEYLANSILFISMGTNDYILNFNNHHDPEYFANYLLIQFRCHHDPEYFANSLLIQFRWLYYIGARNLVVNNIGPLGCLPSMINKTRNGQCDEKMNQNIMPYNSQLPQILKTIEDEYPNATLTLANSYDFLQHILADTEKYGFTDVKDPCCGVYVQGEIACIPNYSTPCDNRCHSLFFDANHTSEFANCIFVRDMLIIKD
ncbi:GDSL esterase/lipase [Camellia lanceoleosa]|uniref:GDSL esterase/lipase n=1 Tax=Camellia lanceoleosa TaxID=1840588 RepID=A0ACC0G368_9ERIC|nr:GDSL esterase/lipase [Camellia lanceoleosa]